jgi:hypothetical protein
MSAPYPFARRLRQARWHRVDDELLRRTVGCRTRLLSACPLIGVRPWPVRPVVVKGPRGVERKRLSESPLKGSRRGV